MGEIVSRITKELKAKANKDYRERQKFYHTNVGYGVRTPIIREISKRYYQEIKDKPKKEIFSLCDQLIKKSYEEKTVGFDWAFRQKKKYEKSDFKLFESWVKNNIDDWGDCDDFCTHTVGEFVLQFPDFTSNLKKWAKSKNIWEKRAAAVSLIYPVRKDSKFLETVFQIADILLEDKEDLVQKGYGWMLKEASNKNQKEVFDYVIKNKDKMPRTSLRYAIEKMPQNLRKKAMER